jgi:hypothetical protein
MAAAAAAAPAAVDPAAAVPVAAEPIAAAAAPLGGLTRQQLLDSAKQTASVLKMVEKAPTFSGSGSGDYGERWLQRMAAYFGNMLSSGPMTQQQLEKLMEDAMLREAVVTQLLKGEAGNAYRLSGHAGALPWPKLVAWVTTMFARPTLHTLDGQLQQLQWRGPFDEGASLAKFSTNFSAAAAALGDTMYTDTGKANLFINALHHERLQEYLRERYQEAADEGRDWGLQHTILQANRKWSQLPASARAQGGSSSSSRRRGRPQRRWRAGQRPAGRRQVAALAPAAVW